MPDAIDPELAPALPLLPTVDLDDVDGVRAGVAAAVAGRPEPDLTGVTVSDERAGDVPLRVHRPDGAAPGVVYDVHGGGFVVGDVDTAHVRNVELARALGVTVVAVGYRLAPETPYPGPLDDVLAGWLWTREHLGPGVVRGESAGGGLAAGLALRLRDTGGPLPGFLLLAQPALDDRLATPSMRAAVDTPVWTRDTAAASWAAYLGPHRDDPPAYAAPARATDLRGLPPAYVAVAQLDPLRDEGVAFALALAAADVTVELHLFPGTFHGSTLVEGAAVSRRQRAEEVEVLRRALGQAASDPASRAAQSS